MNNDFCQGRVLEKLKQDVGEDTKAVSAFIQ